MYIYIYIIYIYIYIYIYIFNELYFGFFQTLKDFKPPIESSKVWKKPNYNSLKNKCFAFDLFLIQK